MKKVLLFAVLVLFSLSALYAQDVPLGMKYQAVARNLKGEVLSNQIISLQISLGTQTPGSFVVHYSETHDVTTSQLGLFDLVIGSGKINKGVFKDVPWSTQDIWMQVAIKDKGSSGFTTISNSRLLAVPYAFHAGTASQLTGNQAANSANLSSAAMQAAAAQAGVPSQVWSLKGNRDTSPGDDNLGTTDFQDLIIITNNIERLRITAAGDVIFKNNLSVEKDLTVKGNVNLNTVYGSTTSNGPFTVAQGKPTTLTGTLSVTQATDLKNTLTVAGATTLNSTLIANSDATFNQKVILSSALGSTSPLTGALVVKGGVGIGQNLNVGGAANFGGSSSFGGKLLVTDPSSSTSTTSGAAVVTGGVGIGKELNVGGATTLGSSLSVAGPLTAAQTLNVTGAASLASTLQVTGAAGFTSTVNVAGATTLQNGLAVSKRATFNDSVVLNSALSSKSISVSNSVDDYVAVFENQNPGNGDGLKIKLGKTNPMWSNGSYVSVPNIAADAFQQPINTIRGWVIDHNPVQASDLLNLFPATLIAGTVVNIVNTVTGKINDALSLPISIGPYGIPAIDIVPHLDGIGGPWGIPATNIIPQLTVFPKIPAIPSAGLPSLTVPNLSFTDVTNSLTSKNEFIAFVDKDNRSLGSIRAQSINDFSANYLDGVYFVNLMASLVGIDIVSGIAGGVAQFTNLADAYNHIGVEYSSGHGDYAEWLERDNPNELISAGDIVAVKGGRITRDLTNAEQVMAVSYRPIIMGNTPPEGKEHTGNKVAFMGQIPVKIMGPVEGGDYIVARSTIPGYGIAVSPSRMSVSDYKLSVGRSWETNRNEGPKMVNTLIGVDNGAYINILKKNQDKVTKIETRINSLEEKMKPLFTSQALHKSAKK